MKFENTHVSNFEGAFTGLRHPMESYKKSDSIFGIFNEEYYSPEYDVAEKWLEQEKLHRKNDNLPELTLDQEEGVVDQYADWLRENGTLQYCESEEYIVEFALLGPNDLALAQRMIAAGSPNDKFLRQIFVSVDISAPRYWWSEADTYKVATVANSTSTMHKLATTPITLDCFEREYEDIELDYTSFATIVQYCENLRLKYLETKDRKYWKALIETLPASWLQKRTWTANYSTLRNIIHWRQNHKLKHEWIDGFCNWTKTLPWAHELLWYHNEPGVNA